MTNDNWRRDLQASSYAFVNYVWPAVAAWCGHGRLELVESSTAHGLTRDFDTLAGIDAWQLLDERGYMRGVASRVQEGDTDWRTFTVRSRRFNGAETEFTKRLAAIRQPRDGALYPALTVHAYVRDFHAGPLLSAAIVRTAELYEYIQIVGARRRSTTNAEFYYVAWADLAQAGVRVRVWPDKSEAVA